MSQPSSVQKRRLGTLACAALAACAGSVGALAQAADPEPIEITAVSTEGDPMDLPGRAPAPKSKSENLEPAPVQSGARPERADEPREWFGPGGCPWPEWSRATGDWGGARRAMEQAGLTFAGSYRFDWTSVTSGGLSDGSYNRRLLDLNLTLDLDPVTNGAWKGGTVYADFYHTAGETGEPSGSVQGTDVITAADHRDQLAELWYQQVLADGVWRLKIGKIDANAEFAALPCVTGFISANAVWDVNLLDMPTYPDPAFGAVVFFTPSDSFYLGGGVFDGATHDGYPTGPSGPATVFSDSRSSSWYIIGEAGFRWPGVGPLFSGQVSVGGWYHTGEYTRFDGSAADGTGGFYVTAQQQISRRGEDEGLSEKGLFAFARAAFADGEITSVQTHIAAGLVLDGTFDGRDDDQAGVMWSFAGLSGASGSVGNENLLEIYYAFSATGSVTVTPYFQWVCNPSGNPAISNATLVGVSVSVSF